MKAVTLSKYAASCLTQKLTTMPGSTNYLLTIKKHVLQYKDQQPTNLGS